MLSRAKIVAKMLQLEGCKGRSLHCRVTLKHDGTDGTDGTRNCFEENVHIAIVQNGRDGTANCSGNPSQATHNVKITFINLIS